MKRIYILVGCAMMIYLFFGCKEKSTVQLQNNISTVKITDVKWGNHFLSNELLPGESSKKITVDPLYEKLPKTEQVTFKMVANNKTVYLETEGKYTLNEEDNLLIVLSDETKVMNPNN
jgi:hypothetical protein